MQTIKALDVLFEGQKVGKLAITSSRMAAFQYDREWLVNGFSVSPISLPLTDEVFYPKNDAFEGLFGVFDDSLPDGWGRLLTDRKLVKHGIDPGSITPLHRLALVGENGKGALEYRPVIEFDNVSVPMSYDEYALECRKILDSVDTDNLDELYCKGGSSGGARPKIMLKEEDGDWIVKFPSSRFDPEDAGEREYRYNLCAAHCGIEIPEVKLFPSELCSGYFGVRRFDRVNKGGTVHRVHMLSAAALLEVSWQLPSLDYLTLMQLTQYLTQDFREAEKMYRLMCFNVFAHNQDDHAKNFSYLYDDGKWWLSPAYDLTYSNSYYGEHATAVNGNGKDPGFGDLFAVGEKAGLSADFCRKTAEEIRDVIETELRDILR